MEKYTLFGSEMSYFSGKARAYMRWKGIDFEEIAPTPAIMKDEILPHIGWPVIPVLKTPNGAYVQDTADIIAYFEDQHASQPVYPSGPVQRFVSYLFQLFADEWMTLPAMHYRWNHNEDWIYGEFGKNALPDGSPEAQYKAGKAVGARFKGFVPMLGITPQTAPGIERAYETFLADFSAHLETFPYVLGTRASFADFALIGPLYAHQYRDESTGEHMRRTAPRVADWVERVISGKGRDGELRAEDVIPATLYPILQKALRDHLPVLQATNELFAAWAETAAEGAELPRGFGMVPFEIGGASGEIAARSFSLFRLQDALDAYAKLSEADRGRTDHFLEAIEADALKTFLMPKRLTRRHYRLALQ